MTLCKLECLSDFNLEQLISILTQIDKKYIVLGSAVVFDCSDVNVSSLEYVCSSKTADVSLYDAQSFLL